MTKKQIVVGVIPARYGSSRFPGKILVDICGKPMIQRVYEQSAKSELIDRLIVAVDDQRVFDCVRKFGGEAIMTRNDHKSGTDRLAEAVEKLDASIVVNIQGDQPLFDPIMIDEALRPLFTDKTIQMSTLKIKIGEEDFNDSAVVKVVVDENDFALYFSRSLIPFSRDRVAVDVYEHVGLYVYRKDFLLEISTWPPSVLEKTEMLEQLRVLEKGYKIKVVETKSDRISGISIDTPEDLEKVKKIIKEISPD